MSDWFLRKFSCIIDRESLHWYYIKTVLCFYFLPWSVLIAYDLVHVFILLVFIILPVYGRNIADTA